MIYVVGLAQDETFVLFLGKVSKSHMPLWEPDVSVVQLCSVVWPRDHRISVEFKRPRTETVETHNGSLDIKFP